MHDPDQILRAVVDPARRSFFKNIGKLGLGVAAGGLLLDFPKAQGQSLAVQDTPNQIFTAALVAEDLASTFYYQGLVGGVIQDPALAGPGGTATNPTSAGDANNVSYLRAALGQEIQHADLLRTVANLGANAATDPYQMFYFPAGTFDTLRAFIATLEALENAFIGAYLVAAREFGAIALETASSVPDGPFGGPYSAAQLNWFAQVAASIMGVEAEHRVLGRDILGVPQANNLYYEQTDGLLTVYNGPNSAVAALMPFLNASTGPGFSLATALSGAANLVLNSNGNPPAFVPVSFAASPNPVLKGSNGDATVTLTWNAPAASAVEIVIGSPNGTVFTGGGNSGSVATGPWATNGMTFYLQDVSNGQPLTSANTLATVTVSVI